MKAFRFLSSLAFGLILFISGSRVHAASCIFPGPLVQLVNSETVIRNNIQYCRTVVNLSIDVDLNNGNKSIYIHLWTAGDFDATGGPATYNYLANAPVTANILGNALFTIALNNSIAGSPTLMTQYPADPAAQVLVSNPVAVPGSPYDAADGIAFTKTQVSGDVYRFRFTNVVIYMPGPCNTSSPTLYKGVAWATNAQAANGKPQCVTGAFSFSLADPTVASSIVCGNPDPNILNFAVTANGTGNTIEFSFDVYQERNGDGIFSVGDELIYNGGADRYTVQTGGISTLNFSSATGTNTATQLYIPNMYLPQYSNTNPYKNSNIYVVLRDITIANGSSVPTQIDGGLVTVASAAGCTPLRSVFGGLSAIRKQGGLVVNWKVISEENCREYVVEASADGNKWVPVGTMQTLSSNGNSSVPLDYSLSLNLPVSLAAVSLGGLFLLGFARSRWARIGIVMLIIVTVASCLKSNESVELNGNEKVLIRIAQYDKDGTITYSNTVNVINE